MYDDDDKATDHQKNWNLLGTQALDKHADVEGGRDIHHAEARIPTSQIRDDHRGNGDAEEGVEADLLMERASHGVGPFVDDEIRSDLVMICSPPRRYRHAR